MIDEKFSITKRLRWDSGPYERIAADLIERQATRIAALESQLAAAQAMNAELRELLPKEIPGGMISLGKQYAEFKDKFASPNDSMSKFKVQWLNACESALSRTSPQDALKRAIAAWVKGESKDFMYSSGTEPFEDFINRRAKELEEGE